jgi:ATPase subunit of ABC transporter with duplicated ATPase domains
MDMANMKAFVAKFGAGSRSTQAKSRLKAMEKMVERGLEEKPMTEKAKTIRFEEARNIKGPMV